MRLKVHRWRRQYGPAHLPSVGTRRAFLDSSPLCWSSSLWRSIHPPRNACRGAAAAAPVLHPPASSASVQEEEYAPGAGARRTTRGRGHPATGARRAGLPLLRLALDLVVLARVEHELVGVAGRHARVALGPVVRDGVREDRPGAVERRAGHRARGGLEGCKKIGRQGSILIGKKG